MPWDERFATGHPELDRQHRVLFDLIDRIGTTEGGVFKPDKHATLDLLEAILQHFGYEDGLMLRFAFPEAEAHRATHRSLGHLIIKLREDVINGSLDHAEFQRFLDDWWREHVDGSDQRLAAFLAGRQ